MESSKTSLGLNLAKRAPCFVTAGFIPVRTSARTFLDGNLPNQRSNTRNWTRRRGNQSRTGHEIETQPLIFRPRRAKIISASALATEFLFFVRARSFQMLDCIVDIEQSAIDPLSNVVIMDEGRCVFVPVPQPIQQTVDLSNRGIIVN